MAFNTNVEIMARGTRFAAEAGKAGGAATYDATDQELKEKFRNNACYSPIKRDKIEKVIESVHDLETLDDMRKLMKLLTIG